MKISDIKGKQIAIKCVTKDEMSKVYDILHNKVAWAFKGTLSGLQYYDGGHIYVFINSNGEYTNLNGKGLSSVNKILAADFFKSNPELCSIGWVGTCG